MPWSHHLVAGHSVEVFEPGVSSDCAAILLHDLDGNVPLRQVISQAPFPVICPLAGRSWWLPVESAGFSDGSLGWVRSAVVPWACETLSIQLPRIGLIGLGMGGQGVLNLCYRHARQFPVVFAISAAVDFHNYQRSEPVLSETFASEEAARQQTATLHLHPLNWPLYQRIMCDPADQFWFEGCERLASKLYSSGIPFDHDFETTTGGNRLTYDERQLKSVIQDLPAKMKAAAGQLEVIQPR